ncbi:TetR family transcriptional regulator [Photobacterium phosphoreum]|jgi:TetR/AcrR family transcriptional repressor of nem operon|uniref:TetR family transcriptional regulator n=1 Tax=Photobacterium phosphoreum TaxID=659 RepID=A0AAW4ZMC4_PHOPO|nr:TetR/AcrR family transcriptional regulator [Photobacterium phosphoreum]MCD9462709.1 TetR/AcrR family transcriptional regulator [Photobacterium phosphoreum]MCD9471120.1 TetR/AcrR family transcriptional regulator [Photobacterium phosphoreum]MCD9474806.1 TetR family transcriptional regulator [Photobacterium phosphoreum]MCD9478882.1 TetR family transcriptional regulator [Photobacterium phosphoreum]MCD9482983.1 TetR family transcriptional regulator [Photobacterium phosphoreum]
MKTKTNDTRQHILDIGYQLVVTKGFTNVGLSEILKTAAVPKGSFYHYFKSKEQFGEALIQHYFEQYLEHVNAILVKGTGTGFDRLTDYFSRWLIIDNGTCNANKCVVVKLSAEVSDLSEPMREALKNGAYSIVTLIALCIDDGIKDGSITVKDSQLAAQTLYQLWLGASLFYKISQDLNVLQQALVTTKAQLRPVL